MVLRLDKFGHTIVNFISRRGFSKIYNPLVLGVHAEDTNQVFQPRLIVTFVLLFELLFFYVLLVLVFVEQVEAHIVEVDFFGLARPAGGCRDVEEEVRSNEVVKVDDLFQSTLRLFVCGGRLTAVFGRCTRSCRGETSVSGPHPPTRSRLSLGSISG